MTLKGAIRDALVVAIRTIPSAGNVHNRAKYSSDWNKFFENFVYMNAGQRTYRGWWLGIPTIPGTSTYDTFDEAWEVYDFPIRGIMSFKDSDETEVDFEDMIYSVFGMLQTSSVVVTPTSDHVIANSQEVSMPIVDFRNFGSILCHYAEIHYRIGVGSPQG